MEEEKSLQSPIEEETVPTSTNNEGNIDNNIEDEDSSETISNEAKETQKVELAGRTNSDPFFYIEPKKAECDRDDKMMLISKKIGFVGLVTFLVLSILFGAIMKYWQNSLNLIFMGFALFAYGMQHILQLKAMSRCNCNSCNSARKKSKLIVTACMMGFALMIVLAVLKSLGYLG